MKSYAYTLALYCFLISSFLTSLLLHTEIARPIPGKRSQKLSSFLSVFIKAGNNLFSMFLVDRTRIDEFKFLQRGFRIVIRKNFLVKPWNRLPREAVGSLSLVVFSRTG